MSSDRDGVKARFGRESEARAEGAVAGEAEFAPEAGR